MKDPETTMQCKSCGFSGKGTYCSQCGQPYKTKRITVHGLLEDLLHFFTHAEKGFLYTLKQLIIAPGHMQRNYIVGSRGRYQPPISMFLICATFTALIRYWILNVVINYYHADIGVEAKFFHEYMVMTYIALLPLYIFILYLLFYPSNYNYAELGVLMLYTLSVFFLAAGLITLLKLVWPRLDTAYMEFPVLTFYLIITLMNFFKAIPRWHVLIKSLIIMALAFFINQVTENFVIRLIS